MIFCADRVMQEMPCIPKTKVETYTSKDIVIFRPNITVPQDASFSNFHMIIPSCPVPLKVDGKNYMLEKDKIFSINPFQDIGGVNIEPISTYTAIFIDSNFLEEIVETVCNKAKISFDNKNVAANYNLFRLLKVFANESVNKQMGYEFVLECLGAQLVIYFLRYLKNNLVSDPVEFGRLEEKGVDRAIEYIRTYYNEGFSLSDIASIANLSPYHFIRVFRAETGKTPFEYLIDVRIEMAKILLRSNEYKVTEVGMKCGFSNPSHFSTTFKKKTGFTPTKYRETIT